MSKLYITEYEHLPLTTDGRMSAGQEPALATQTVTFTTATQSAAFNARTTFVRVHAPTICSILFGSNPTADVNSPRLAANQTEYFGVRGGDKLSAIDNT